MMQRITTSFTLAAATLLAVAPAFAGEATNRVPEIDGSSAGLALALTVGIVALVREYRRK